MLVRLVMRLALFCAAKQATTLARRNALRLTAKGGRGGAGLAIYGGVGGDGGSLSLRPLKSVHFDQLSAKYAHNPTVEASAGSNAVKTRLVGDAGRSTIIDVPLDVECIDLSTREMIARCGQAGKAYLIVKGGAGGSSANQYKSVFWS